MNKETLELVKNIGGAAKNFKDVISEFLSNDPVDIALAEGFKQLVSKVVNGEQVKPGTLDLLCGFKKLVKEERRKKDIASKALDFLNDSAKPHEVEVDWLEFFFEKAKLVTNNEMQLIWARLLAEEANEPGKISLSLLHAISVMRFEQAQFFCKISQYAPRTFGKTDANPLLFINTNHEAYEDQGITFSKLRELERLGLVECNFEREYVFEKKKVLVFGNKSLDVRGDPEYSNKIKAGNVIFTQDGQVLYDIIDHTYKQHRKGIFEFAIRRFKARNCRVYVDGKEIL